MYVPVILLMVVKTKKMHVWIERFRLVYVLKLNSSEPYQMPSSFGNSWLWNTLRLFLRFENKHYWTSWTFGRAFPQIRERKFIFLSTFMQMHLPRNHFTITLYSVALQGDNCSEFIREKILLLSKQVTYIEVIEVNTLSISDFEHFLS